MNLSNLPTDFADGDLLLIIGHQTYSGSPPTSWTTSPSGITLASGGTGQDRGSAIIMVNSNLREISFYDRVLGSRTAIQSVSITDVKGASDFNTGTWFDFENVVYNNAGCIKNTVTITRSNVSDYILKVYRIKSN